MAGETEPHIGPIEHINPQCQPTGCDCWCKACERHNWRHSHNDLVVERAVAAERERIMREAQPKIDGFRNAEHDAAEAKDWPMADRWRYLADGAAALLAIIDREDTDHD